MRRPDSKQVTGVVGGMGPMASAEFLKTIYEYAVGVREQESPVVMVYSDPTFPDRTDAFLSGEDGAVLEQLLTALRRLRDIGASQFILCCMTIHYLLPRLDADLRSRIISLLDVIYDALPESGRRHLLLCSSGTRKLGLFENHPDWQRLKGHFVMPDDADQAVIHRDMIYPVKTDTDLSVSLSLIEELLIKYKVDSFIAGCSEVHMLAKRFFADEGRRKEFGCVDPFAIIAESLKGERR